MGRNPRLLRRAALAAARLFSPRPVNPAAAGRKRPGESATQPLTIQVNQGECFQVTLRNAMDNGESVSLHLHGSSLHLAGSGAPAMATNPDAVVVPLLPLEGN